MFLETLGDRGILVCVVLIVAAAVVGAARFQDASDSSDFGSNLRSSSPWRGDVRDILVRNLDADAAEEILVGGVQNTCGGQVEQLAVFALDALSNRYVQLDYGRQHIFLGIPFMSYSFEATSGPPSALPNIVACEQSITSSGYAMVLLRNRGALNFSVASDAFLGGAPCSQEAVIAAADTDGDLYDEVFVSTDSVVSFWAGLPNMTFANASYRIGLAPLQYSAATFADLDGDSDMDLIWMGKDKSSVLYAYTFHNVMPGNLTSVPTSISPVLTGTILVEKFTGNVFPEIVVCGEQGYALSFYENFGSFNFSLRVNAFANSANADLTAAAVPLKDSAVMDVVVVSTSLSTTPFQGIFFNNGSGYFTLTSVSFWSSSFTGRAARGPNLGTRASFVSFGDTIAALFQPPLTTLSVIWDGYVRNYARDFFNSSDFDRDSSIFLGDTIAMDVSYDGCVDAWISGLLPYSETLYSVLLLGDCFGSFRPYTGIIQPVYQAGEAIAHDFDQDGLIEVFYVGLDTLGDSVGYYRFLRNITVENVTNHLLGVSSGSSFSSACAGSSSGNIYWDIYISGIAGSNPLSQFLRNLRNGSFVLVESLLNVANIFSGSCAFSSGGVDMELWKDIISVGFSNSSVTAFNYMRNLRNGTFLNAAADAAFFNGALPPGCSLSSMVVADLNGDLMEDLFYNGLQSPNYTISRLYLRNANGSMTPSTVLSSFGTLTELYDSSSLALDIDSDGDLDLVLTGSRIGEASVLAALMNNDGLGNFSDGTTDVFGILPGFSYGSLVAAQFNYDSLPDILHIGLGSFCGPRVLLQLENSSSVSATTSASISTDIGDDTAALIGGLAGGLGSLLVLTAACCFLILLCCFCCCFLSLIVLAAIVAVALVTIVAVAIGLFAAGDAGIVFFLIRGKKRKKEDVEMDEMDVAALLADAERTGEYRIIPWPEIHTVKKLGAGAYGEVMLAEWNGVEVAVKLFRNPSKEAIDDYKHEALMMAKVSHHPNVVNFIGASFPPDGMAMVLGLCAGGSLLAALEEKKLDAAKKTKVLGEVASALSFLHSLGIVHRDIAARNVLLDGSGKAKLADLGLSRLLEDKQGEQTTKEAVGPVRWMAPEALSSHTYSSASDCYSFGVLIAEVWSDGEVPLGNIASVADVAIAVLQKGARPRLARGTPAAYADLARKMFSGDSSQRPTMMDAQRVLRQDDPSNDPVACPADCGEYVFASDLH